MRILNVSWELTLYVKLNPYNRCRGEYVRSYFSKYSDDQYNTIVDIAIARNWLIKDGDYLVYLK